MTNKAMTTKVPLDDGSSAFKLHLANIMCLQYGPINCLSLNSTNTKLALFRGGEAPAIEIWDVSHIPFLQKVLYDLEAVNDKVSVESLVWIGDRLFSCGLHGFVVEHDLVTRRMKRKYMATSGPVWNLSVNPDNTLLGAATEDGFINIFQVTDEELLFQKVLDRQEGRILCLCWSPCGKYIATGSVDNIRLWDVERGHAIQRLTTGRSKKNETIVWTVLIIDELTIVSGDSRGVVSFWDGRIGVLKFKIFTHRADILRLSSSPDQSLIYVSGVDPSVVLLSRVGKTGEKWVKSHQRNMHTNDVMCLETMGNQLISAGVDCELTISTPPMRGIPRSIRKYPPIPKAPRIFVSTDSKRILVQEDRGINVWELPGRSEELVKLIDFRSRGNQIINSSCMNPSGQVFSYSTKSTIHLFRLVTCADGRTIPVKLKRTTSMLSPVTLKKENLFDPEDMLWSLHFLNDTRLLAVSLDGALIQILQVDDHSDTYTLKSEILMEDYLEPIGINLVATRLNGNLVAVVTSDDTVHLVEISEEGTIAECYTVPRHHCPITSLEFHPELPYLLITYADHTVRIFNFLSSEIVFHEEIGGPRVKGKGKIKKVVKKGIREDHEQQEDGNSKGHEETPEHEECHHSVLGTTWSLDGTKVIFHEIDRMHLMEFSQVPPNGVLNNQIEDEPASKKLRRESLSALKEKKIRGKQNRSSSSSPVPHSGKAEEWISNKLYSMKLNNLPKKRNIVADSSYDAFIDWRVLNCEKTYKYVAHASFLEDSKEMLVVEVKPSSLLSKLPPAFARKRFGM